VDGKRFQIFISIIIALNALVLGLSTYEWISASWGTYLSLFNEVFFAIFIIELILRIASYGSRPWNFFRSGWNIFDFIVIGGALLPVLRDQTTILRLLRLARIVRLIRFLPDTGVLIRTVTKATPAVMSMAVLTTLIIFVYAIIGWSLFGAALPNEWGNVGVAMLTLFVLLTLENFPDYLGEARGVSPFATVFFLSYVLLAAFVVVNLLIGIVLSAMDRAREEDLQQTTQETQNDVEQILHKMDELASAIAVLQEKIDSQDSSQKPAP
jgi:voltage-gated sodium channel